MPHIHPATLCQIEIRVTDLDRSKLFYRHVFGWNEAPVDIHGSVIFEVPAISPFGMRLVEHKPGLGASPSLLGIIPYFLAENFDGISQRVKDQGGHCEGAIQKVQGYGSIMIVEDPDGNKLGLFLPQATDSSSL